MFKIPLMDYNKVCACSIKKNSELAKLLSMTSLIVWDEVVMANKNTLATLDVSLWDILGVPGRFMGGIVFVCAGDFRQILPVIRGGGMNDELEYCIKSGYFWDDLLKLELTRIVRLKADDTKNKIFAKNLLALGRGESGPVKLPEKFGIVVETRKELVDKVYDNLEENHLNTSYFEKRAIISPTNDDVDRINLMVYDKSEEPEKVYMSVDTAMEEVTDIQTSVFNAITSPSLPLHMLRLKVGSVIMVMRNICPPKLCNGSRVIVTNLKKYIIVGKILGGTHRDEQVLLPRITLESTDTTIPFKRKQFPVKLSYAMTINKSQGQTFDRCGILLDSAQCFAHGQLYVACSRVTSWNSLIIYTGWEKVNDDFRKKLPRNCVYKELFVESLSEEDKPPEAVVVSDDQEVALAEEEPDQSIVEIPKEVYTISEEEAVDMLLPASYVPKKYLLDDHQAEFIAR
ncbi:ATP-dependent DNA helicase Pif1-like [Oratosquilla oratoria]|uniref:ATP-dependent DNA helicase Pif1-like n=1 Tax=Oratosquilla oratoria TaxID=337810 RepID=UPI003F775366